MYNMKDVCEKTNLNYETLRYYCNLGLVPNVKRDKIIIDYLMIVMWRGLMDFNVLENAD